MPMPEQGQPQPQGGGALAQAAAAAAQVPDPSGQAVGGQPPPPAGGQPPPPVGGAAVGQPDMQQTQAPESPVPGPHAETMPQEGQAYHPESDASVKTEAATDDEEREYKRVSGALDKVLYEEDKLIDSIMQQLNPDDKIGSTTKATALLIQQLDKRVNMDEIVIPQITMDAVDAVAELAENRFNMPFSEQELQATLGATWESVMAMFGVDQKELDRFMQGYQGQGNAMKKAYNGFLGQGKKSTNPAAKLPAPEAPPPQMPPQAAAAAPPPPPAGGPTSG